MEDYGGIFAMTLKGHFSYWMWHVAQTGRAASCETILFIYLFIYLFI